MTTSSLRFALASLAFVSLGVGASAAKPKNGVNTANTASSMEKAVKPTLIPSLPSTTWHTWSDDKGNRVEAELLSLDGEHVMVRTKEGQSYRLNLTRLVPSDRDYAQKAQRLLPGIEMPAAKAAATIDQFVLNGLNKVSLKPNPPLPEEQFVRRVYLDVAGRIPTAKEVFDYARDQSADKRAKLIDSLLSSEGYNSQLFNWLADLLRLADNYGKGVKSYVYQEWIKEQIASNRHWDSIVYEMMTAEGRISNNGPVGYLLRDRGMPLDNLSNTLTTFLGANVACAQCHDHPSANWTERNFYEMAAYFGATEQGFSKKPPFKFLTKAGIDKRLAISIMAPNAAKVETLDKITTVFPEDYKYDDAKPGDRVHPKLITWEKGDEKSEAYIGASTDKPAELREHFAVWLTHPDNPRFALSIANRIWKKLFGLAVQEPVTDLDDLKQASNPELLQHLASEMKRVHFDLREFQRILLNTAAYQAQASPTPNLENGPYLFPGPVLRRMTGEQTWDSILTLAVGTELDKFKLQRAGEVRRFDIPDSQISVPTVLAKIEELKASAGKGKKMGGKRGKNADPGLEEIESNPPPKLENLTLARASELTQPSKESHFLRNFGQSDRQIAESNSTEGGVPQILMMMNGEVQKVLTSPQSTVLRETMKLSSQADQIRFLYLSFLGRLPSPSDLAITQNMLASGLTPRDLVWVFLNTREFLFIQ